MVTKFYSVDDFKLGLHASANKIAALVALAKNITGKPFKYIRGYLVYNKDRAKVITSTLYIGEDNDLIMRAGQTKYIRDTEQYLINKRPSVSATA